MVTNGLSTTRYTPLESLLFFQALRSEDLSSINFGKISNDLATLPLVKNDASFDRDRLSAHALQNLYFSLVKEEAREELENTTTNNLKQPQQNGELSPGSRKRKAASPTLPTVEAAAKHLHLLPRLITKLYARYRETIVAAIKEEERTINVLDQEIKQFEDGEFDEKLRSEDGIPAPQQASEDTRPKGMPTEAIKAPEQTTSRPTTADAYAPAQSPSEERPRSSKASIDALVNHTPEPESIKAPSHGRQPSGTTSTGHRGSLPPLSEMAPEHITGPSMPQQARPPSGHSPVQHHGPPPPVYQASPPVKHSSPYLNQYPMAAPSPPSQHQAASQSPTSPARMLPVPPGMKVQGSPVMQNGFQPPPPPGQMPMQPPHYGSPSQQRPSPVQASPAGRGYPPPQQQYPYAQQYQQYPGPQQQPYMQHPQAQQAQYQIRPSQQGGFQLPPFQVSAQDPSKVRHQYNNQRGTPQQNRYTQPHPSQPVPGGQSPYAQYSPFPQTPQPPPRLSLDSQRLTNSVIASLRKRRSTSTWKTPNHTPLNPPRSPTRPAVEPFSPTKPAAKPVENVRAEIPSSPPPEDSKPDDDTKQRKPIKKTTRKTRGSSVASSNIASSTRGRTRSQSVMSHADTATAEGPSTRTRGGVKAEPSTPAEPASDPTETPAAKATRPRRSTLQPPSSAVRASPRGTPAPSNTDHREARRDVVYATRNFSRLSSVILNEISAHRHAGPFQKPVSERDVEGYNDIIKRPQDLKSIKAAITAGSRAVNAAVAAKEAEAEGEEEDGAGQSTGSTIMLPKSEDLIPPKGIVNSAQLEKEVMRMFANAVMFNPGEEGFVVDAREMADDVARKVGDWRGVETHEGDAGAGGQGSVKRRKL
ncbi:Bromodomain-containing protein 8 [Elsinoe australis]|uniref:Bromodomain-containing protein 8 n=1 Tax=Elsinoe australis TaxID=40998 RepID=A0A2P7YVV4_9PEZI|nr:Bromodomain-containing protein 8 [Elsinoe australis]